MICSGNLLILLASNELNEELISREVEQLKYIFAKLESPQQFCTAFELVNRNGITSNQKKIEKESKHYRLRAFRFLINKN